MLKVLVSYGDVEDALCEVENGREDDLYDALCDEINDFVYGDFEKGEVFSIEIVEDGKPVTKPHVMEFFYDGFTRQVENPQFVKGVLTGFELTRGGVKSEQVKSYSLTKINQRVWR